MDVAGFIDGAFAAGEGAMLRVENPSDESTVAEFAGLSADQVDRAIGVARISFDDGRWSGLSNHARAEAIARYGAALRQHRDTLRELAVTEAGCPVGSSVMNAQVDAPLKMTDEIIDLFLSLPEFTDNPVPPQQRIGPTGAVMQSVNRYAPIGVVSAISAYNVPFYTAFWKVIPALIAGNSVVLRPNPLTPLSALIFAEAAQEAGLPDGVLNVITEAGVDGAQAITTDPRVDMVSFTGSCGVGVQVAQQAAGTLKRLVLELGGKSAQIFLPDAVEKAALQAMVVCIAHAGQGCALGTRLFVPEDRKGEVLDAAKALLEKIKVGPGNDPATQTGPVISAAQRARCEHFTQAAVAAGGRVVTGGKRPAQLDKGYFWEPTLLDLPDNANPAAQEEIFGPVVSVIGYRDLDHAVAMANDSKFGLSGYVHGADKRAALEVGMRIRSGTVNVNGALMSSYASSGGIKLSGQGRERGVEGLRAFQQHSVLNIGG